MISEKLSLWFSRRTQWVFSVAIAVLAIAFIISMLSMNIAQNVESRALSELQSTVGMQASTFTDHMDAQFQALQLVADMLANGRHFASEELQPTLTSVVDTFRLCTLCLADTDGNTTEYLGNILGSCSDREYFREIIDGNVAQIFIDIHTSSIFTDDGLPVHFVKREIALSVKHSNFPRFDSCWDLESTHRNGRRGSAPVVVRMGFYSAKQSTGCFC